MVSWFTHKNWCLFLPRLFLFPHSVSSWAKLEVCFSQYLKTQEMRIFSQGLCSFPVWFSGESWFTVGNHCFITFWVIESLPIIMAYQLDSRQNALCPSNRAVFSFTCHNFSNSSAMYLNIIQQHIPRANKRCVTSKSDAARSCHKELKIRNRTVRKEGWIDICCFLTHVKC